MLPFFVLLSDCLIAAFSRNRASPSDHLLVISLIPRSVLSRNWNPDYSRAPDLLKCSRNTVPTSSIAMWETDRRKLLSESFLPLSLVIIIRWCVVALTLCGPTVNLEMRNIYRDAIFRVQHILCCVSSRRRRNRRFAGNL